LRKKGISKRKVLPKHPRLADYLKEVISHQREESTETKSEEVLPKDSRPSIIIIKTPNIQAVPFPVVAFAKKSTN